MFVGIWKLSSFQVSTDRSYYLTGQLAELEQALVRYEFKFITMSFNTKNKLMQFVHNFDHIIKSASIFFANFQIHCRFSCRRTWLQARLSSGPASSQHFEGVRHGCRRGTNPGLFKPLNIFEALFGFIVDVEFRQKSHHCKKRNFLRKPFSHW